MNHFRFSKGPKTSLWAINHSKCSKHHNDILLLKITSKSLILATWAPRSRNLSKWYTNQKKLLLGQSFSEMTETASQTINFDHLDGLAQKCLKIGPKSYFLTTWPAWLRNCSKGLPNRPFWQLERPAREMPQKASQIIHFDHLGALAQKLL